MPPQRTAAKAQQEGRILLAIHALRTKQISSVRKAAVSFHVPRRTLSTRLHGRVAREDTGANSHKLTPTEEQSLVEWILDLDERGYPLRI